MPTLPTGLPVEFLTRSWLMIPPLEEAALHIGAKSGADVLVIDFCAVLPARFRDAADLAVRFLTETNRRRPGSSEPACFVAVPALDAEGETLIDEIMRGKPEGIMLADATGPEIQHLHVLLDVQEALHGLESGIIKIAALSGNIGATEFAGFSDRLIALGWSAQSLMDQLGAQRMHDNQGFLTDAFRIARSSILTAASEAHIEVIDTLSGLISTERLLRDAREAAADGFTGKFTMSPRQVSAINHAFSPRPEDIEEARHIVKSIAEVSSIQRLRALRTLQRSVPQAR